MHANDTNRKGEGTRPMKKDFDTWNHCKKYLHYRKRQIPYFYEREIWWCALGVNIGHEQDGRHGNFERPVLILKKFNRHVFLGIPLTTKEHVVPYHISLHAHRDEVHNFAIISQTRLLSSKRLLRRVRLLSKNEFHFVRRELKRMLK